MNTMYRADQVNNGVGHGQRGGYGARKFEKNEYKMKTGK